MPNIAAVLRDEISRIARKEVRSETLALKKAAATHRSEIAALKRRTNALEQQLHRLARKRSESAPADEKDDAQGPTRFSAKGLASQRRRLGLSAADCGLLLGTSAQSVYNWEEGKVRPRTKHLAAIAALKTLGKKAAATHLQSLKEGS